MSNLEGVTYEDFGGIRSFSNNKHVNGNVETINMLSPYADKELYPQSSAEYINWYDINTGVTPLYAATDDSDATLKLGLCRDIETNTIDNDDTSRAPLSRHYWSGTIKTDTVAGSSCFTYSDLTSGQSDGYLHLLDPVVSQFSTYINSTGIKQSALSLELQFNNLPAFTWVPLAGVTMRQAGKTNGGSHSAQGNVTQVTYPDSQMYWNNSEPGYSEHYTSSNTYEGRAAIIGYVLPGGISDSTNNHYGRNWSTIASNNIQFSYTTWYIMYCHDGNGKGMLASAPGMIGKTDISSLNVYNGQDGVHCVNSSHGVSGQDGHINWTAPSVLTDWFTSDTGDESTRLQRLWDQYNTTHKGKNIYSKPHGDWVLSNQNAVGYMATMYHGYYNRWTTRYNNASNTRYNFTYARMFPMNSMLIAYGSMDNADLSDPTTLYLNRSIAGSIYSYTSNRQYGGSLIDTYGNTNYQVGTWGTNTGAAFDSSSMYFTGKFGSLAFHNVPGPHKNGTGGESHLPGGFMQNPGWVIQPTVVGQGQINKFAIGSYPALSGTGNRPDTTSGSWMYSSSVGYIVPFAGEDYLFPSFNQQITYSPTDTINSESDRLESAAGAWENADNMFDDDTDTSAVSLLAGESNALYIKMQGADASYQLDSSNEINKLVITIQGIQTTMIDKQISFSITDSDKSTIIAGAESITFADGLSLGTGNVFPPEGSYNLTVAPSSGQSVSYDQVSGGYLKMWIEDSV